MLPKAFYLLMLPLGIVAVARPDSFSALLAMVGHQPAAATAPATPAAPSALTATPNGGYPSRRLAAGRDGHVRARAQVGGRSFEMLVDTGATIVALTWTTGLDLGLVRPGMTMDTPMQTANGRVLGKRVTIPRLEVEGLSVAAVDAVVLPQGALAVNLLGMSFLAKLRRFEFAQNTLLLEQ
ncbi:TIGR02281 family clan AA aspartic protease [Phreatobacter sp.]|uniref:TIGR02281 family clan AA aspartic protease n=1 Tax=Phreatobacter sp. TaxID=1966341 RepID=UPI0025D13536|nr:TIGR02281 family clan AA aspartic protease [Phreatobacter sp.]